MSFNKYNFKDYIKQGLDAIGFENPTEIQERIIPLVLGGNNVIGKSQTGTGKTHSFILPILQKLDEKLAEVQATIIVPTRELASQIYNDFNNIIKYSPEKIDIRMYVGGTNRQSEMERLKKSQPQIVIGTIGKIKDLASDNNLLKIYTSKIVVIDEADMALDLNELEDLDYVFSLFKDAQYLSFSATLNKELVNFINKYISVNEFVDLVGTNVLKESIEHVFIPTKNKDKDEVLLELLEIIKPYLVLIFANTVEKVDEIANMLSEKGYKVGKITGNLEPRERRQVIKRIKDGIYQYVVCSDIASRGMDITGVSHIINYELPKDYEYYIHRIGRTARFESTGMAISFYDYEDASYLNKLSNKNITYKFMMIKDGELVITQNRNVSFKQMKTSDIAIHKKYPLGKKVKPGYRKKRNEAIKKEISKIKRKKIDSMYKRLSNKNDL